MPKTLKRPSLFHHHHFQLVVCFVGAWEWLCTVNTACLTIQLNSLISTSILYVNYSVSPLVFVLRVYHWQIIQPITRRKQCNQLSNVISYSWICLILFSPAGVFRHECPDRLITETDKNINPCMMFGSVGPITIHWKQVQHTQTLHVI